MKLYCHSIKRFEANAEKESKKIDIAKLKSFGLQRIVVHTIVSRVPSPQVARKNIVIIFKIIWKKSQTKQIKRKKNNTVASGKWTQDRCLAGAMYFHWANGTLLPSNCIILKLRACQYYVNFLVSYILSPQQGCGPGINSLMWLCFFKYLEFILCQGYMFWWWGMVTIM